MVYSMSLASTAAET